MTLLYCSWACIQRDEFYDLQWKHTRMFMAALLLTAPTQEKKPRYLSTKRRTGLSSHNGILHRNTKELTNHCTQRKTYWWEKDTRCKRTYNMCLYLWEGQEQAKLDCDGGQNGDYIGVAYHLGRGQREPSCVLEYSVCCSSGLMGVYICKNPSSCTLFVRFM